MNVSVCCLSVSWSFFQMWCNHISVNTMSWFLMNKKKEGEKRSTEIKRQFLRAVSISIDYNHYARSDIWKIRFHFLRTTISTNWFRWARSLMESWAKISGWMFSSRRRFTIPRKSWQTQEWYKGHPLVWFHIGISRLRFFQWGTKSAKDECSTGSNNHLQTV